MTLALAGSPVSAEAILIAFAAALAALAGWLGFLWQGRAPAMGLAALLVLAVLWPVDLPAGLPAPLALTALLCVSWFLHGFILRRQFALQRSRLVAATLAFMAIAVLAFLVGQYPWFPAEHAPMRAQLGGLALFLLSGGLLLLVGHQVGSVRQLERLTWLFMALGAVLVVKQLLPLGGLGLRLSEITQESSVGSMFWVWIVAVGLSQGLFNTRLPLPARGALVAVAALALLRGVWLAFDWVSGWGPPLIAAGVILFLRFPRTAIGGGLLLAAPALVVAVPALQSLLTGGESYSYMTRLEAMAVMAKIIGHNPWLGFGPANYYHYTLLFPILGWWVRFNSHNNYIDLVAQVGVIGLAAFVWIVVEAGRGALTLSRHGATPFVRAYAVGALGGLAASVVAAGLADWVVPFAYNIGIVGFRSSLLFWFFLGGLLALRRFAQAGQLPGVMPWRTPAGAWTTPGPRARGAGASWVAVADAAWGGVSRPRPSEAS